MNSFNRRDFLKLAGAAAGVAVSGFPAIVRAGEKARVIVIGGGYGGAICAKYLKMADPGIKVTLIEKESHYVSCPMSNEVISGERELDSITFTYRGLSAHGVQIMQDEITRVDPHAKAVWGSSGNKYRYDFLVVSPGVDYKWEGYNGFSEEASREKMPHAWKAGPQTILLRDQLRAMPDGGTAVIVAPPNPFHCPPGPYERAAQFANYLKHSGKTRSKVIILDQKDKFSKQGLFMQGWKQHYGNMIEWRGASGGGKVDSIDVDEMTIIGDVEDVKGDVVNVIPPQKAGHLAQVAGLANDSGWCPVDQANFESTIHKDIYVIGDACIAGSMPKSGYAANSQGKVAATHIAARINGISAPEPSYVNTCYSVIAPGHGISVAAVYTLQGGKISGVKGAGGLSPMDASAAVRAVEEKNAHGWFRNIVDDMFG